MLFPAMNDFLFISLSLFKNRYPVRIISASRQIRNLVVYFFKGDDADSIFSISMLLPFVLSIDFTYGYYVPPQVPVPVISIRLK